MGKRAPKNRSTKTSIVFDEAARTEFLTGFRKRKEERRKKAKEQMEKEAKEEMKRAKEKARDFVARQRAGEMSSSNKIVPEIEHLLPTSVRDLGSHTVSVTHIDDLVGLQQSTNDLISHSDGLRLTREDKREMNHQFKSLQEKSKKIKKASKLLSKGKDRTLKKKQRKCMKSKRERHNHPKKLVKK